MVSLIIFDPSSATIFFAMFIALAITRKIDNPAFYIGTGILLLLPIILVEQYSLSIKVYSISKPSIG